MAEFKDIVYPEIVDIIRLAQGYAKENVNSEIEPSHLFKALLHKDVGLVQFIEKDLGQDYYYLLDWADMRIKMEKKSPRPNAEITLSKLTLEVILEAENICEKIGEEDVSPKVLLASIVTPGVGFTFEQLKTLPLTKDEVLGNLSTFNNLSFASSTY